MKAEELKPSLWEHCPLGLLAKNKGNGLNVKYNFFEEQKVLGLNLAPCAFYAGALPLGLLP
jgi:hypothetical protein